LSTKKASENCSSSKESKGTELTSGNLCSLKKVFFYSIVFNVNSLIIIFFNVLDFYPSMSCNYTFIARAPIDNSILFINAAGITLTEINKSICSVQQALGILQLVLGLSELKHKRKNEII